MAADRDVAVAFATAWAHRLGRRLAGWEMTAATGVRGLRLAAESGAFERFCLTEANDAAAELLGRNAAGRPGVTTERRDARTPPAAAAFDYVDLDPYGTPAPFVPAALSAVRPDGVIAVTATDMVVLAGVQKGACERRYGARPVRGRLAPEAGLRILIGYLAREARVHGLALQPLLAYVREHYVRVYAQLVPDARNEIPSPVETLEPGSWTGPPLGDPGPFGPLWVGPLYDRPLVLELAPPAGAARPRETELLLERWREESAVDVPFYYEANRLAGRLRLRAPPPLRALLEGLRARGFRAGRTHARPEGFRTDAPRAEVERLAEALGRGAG